MQKQGFIFGRALKSGMDIRAVVRAIFLAVWIMPAAVWGTDCSDYPDPYYEDINGDGIDGDTGRAIFVSISYGNDEFPGTMLSPVQSIARGIALAVQNGKPHVYVARGNYEQLFSPLQLANGVSLFGQFSGPPEWGRGAGNTATITGYASTAVLAQNLTAETHLEGFNIEVVGGASKSRYGVRVVGGTGRLYIRFNNILVSFGVNGEHGIPGDNGSFGENGGVGLPGACPGSSGAGGAGGFSICGASGGVGGTGVSGSPGSGGAPGGSVPSGAGANGANGASGANGAGGSFFSVAGGLYLPADGAAGSGGSPGGGGGGGGAGPMLQCSFLCAFFGGRTGGSGGGSGGCGGEGGSGGKGGGECFGVFVVDGGQAVVDGNSITTSRGGHGGVGGDGSFGVPGGQGGGANSSSTSCNVSAGGAGGNGGLGGPGGEGGGGAGGASVGVFCYNQGYAIVGSSNSFTIGPGGFGGAAPNPGTAGISGSLYGTIIYQSPSISSATPPDGASGDTVVLSGSDFDTDRTRNVVCFGGAQATVLAASLDSLLVRIPPNAATGHIKLIKTIIWLEAYSPSPYAVCAAHEGDMNADANLSPADVVSMLNCVFLASGSCDLCFADVNCTGDLSPADVVIELNMVFLGSSPPC